MSVEGVSMVDYKSITAQLVRLFPINKTSSAYTKCKTNSSLSSLRDDFTQRLKRKLLLMLYIRDLDIHCQVHMKSLHLVYGFFIINLCWKPILGLIFRWPLFDSL